MEKVWYDDRKWFGAGFGLAPLAPLAPMAGLLPLENIYYLLGEKFSQQMNVSIQSFHIWGFYGALCK